MEYLLYSVHFENAINEIDNVLNSKELSLLSLVSLASSQDDVENEIAGLFNKVKKAMRFVDIFRDDNVDVEDSEYKEEEVNVKIHDLIEELEDLNEYDLSEIINMLKRRAK